MRGRSPEQTAGEFGGLPRLRTGRPIGQNIICPTSQFYPSTSCAAGAWHGRGLVCYASSGKEGKRRLPEHALYDLRSRADNAPQALNADLVRTIHGFDALPVLTGSTASANL